MLVDGRNVTLSLCIYNVLFVHFRLRATWENTQGPYSEVVACTTPLTVPDKPISPRVTHKTKNALTLKWNVR